MKRLISTLLLLVLSCSVRQGNLIGSSESGQFHIVEANNVSAEIFVDGISTGQHTPAVIANIPQGQHIFSLIHIGYRNAADTMTINPGDTGTISLSLQATSSAGTISFNSSWIGADVSVDGLIRGQIPLTLSDLSQGNHQIRIQMGNAYTDSNLNLSSTSQSLSMDPTPHQWLLLEHFSNIACMPCPSVDRAIEAFLASQNNPRIVHLSMHINSPSPDDIFFVPYAAEILARISPDYYNVGSVPRVLLNGTLTGSRQDSADIPIYLQDTLSQVLSQIPSLNLSLSGLSNGDSTVSGNLLIQGLSNQSGFRIMVALVENQIHFNAPPGVNGLKDFVDMFRGFATLAANPTTINQGDHLNIPFQISHNLKGRPLSILAWVENPTNKTILQSYRQNLPLIP